MLIVSMYTPHTEYENEIKRLERSLNKFKLDYNFYPIRNLNDWGFNCGQNAGVILDAMIRYNDDILFLDADAEVVGQIDLSNLDCDIALHRIQYENHFEHCTGTFYAMYTGNTIKFLQDWAVLNSRLNDDQKNCETAIHSMPNLNVVDLSKRFCFIKNNRIQRTCIDPVIIHHQASRRLKNIINAK